MTDLALGLKRLGHKVTVLTTTPHYNIDQSVLVLQPMHRKWKGLLYYSECDGIPVWHVKIPMKGQRVWARVLDYIRFHVQSLVVSLLLLGPQDIVITTSPPLTMGVMSWLLRVRFGAPSVYIVAEVYPDVAIRLGVLKHSFLIGLMRWLEKFVYWGNSMIVPITVQLKKVLQGRGVPEHKLMMITEFVDPDVYRPLSRINPFAQAHELQEDFVVLYAGNIGLVQDWESVLFAAKASSGLPIQFVIVGDGSLRSWLEKQAQKRGLTNVKVLGYQPKGLMPQVYASCDISTIPMKRAGTLDLFPSKMFVIMASGKPVIASAIEGSELAWIIGEAGCGKVVPPDDPQAFADAVLAAFREKGSLSAVGLRGRKFVEKDYSKETVVRKYDHLIYKLTSH